MDPASRPRSANTSSSASTAPTAHARAMVRGWGCQSRAGSSDSSAAGSSPGRARLGARPCPWTCLPYVVLRCGHDADVMFDIAPDHAIGLYAGLLALPLALIAIRLRPGRRGVAVTVLGASVLMAVAGAIHLALISTHRSEPLTALLFLANGAGYIALSFAFTWRLWRLASAAPPIASTL